MAVEIRKSNVSDPGYVEYGYICDERYPYSKEYEAVMRAMPAEDWLVINHQARSIGLGTEAGVIIDQSDYHLQKYKNL